MITYPAEHGRLLYACEWIARELTYRRPSLLWITNPHIFSSNWHLYYRLRQSYADTRKIDDAPGHLFLGYESADLASYLQLCVVNAWDAEFVNELGYVGMALSHDGFFDFTSNDDALIAEVRKDIGEQRDAT